MIMPDTKSLALGLFSLLVVIFLFLPIVTVVVYSFNVGDYLIIWKGGGWRWYLSLIDDQNIHATLANSLIAGVLSTVFSVFLGGISGMILGRWPAPVAAPLGILLVAVISFPEIVKAVAYLTWFVDIGLDIGIVRIAIAHGLFGSAITAFIIRSRLASLDGRLEEAAADLGATPLVGFFTVTLPMLMPAFVVGALLSFTLSLDDVIVALFVSTADSTTLPVFILSSVRQGIKGDIAAVSSLLFALTMLIFALAGILIARGGSSRRDTLLMLAGQSDAANT